MVAAYIGPRMLSPYMQARPISSERWCRNTGRSKRSIILDNLSAHKAPAVRDFLEAQPCVRLIPGLVSHTFLYLGGFVRCC
jgi:hypothetical protein